MEIEQRVSGFALKGIVLAVGASALDPGRRRSAVLYLLVTCGNVPGALAARAAGCTKQNVSKLLRKVEERREDAAFDAELSRLETAFFGEGQ